MAKVKKKKRIIRQDLVQKRLPSLYKGTKHSAYSWMKRCKQGQLPPGNTNIAKTLAAIEVELIEHFGNLNGPQQIQLNLLRPLFTFWLLHPGTTEDDEDKLAFDFKWVHGKLESGLKVLCELGSSKPQGHVPTIPEIIAQIEAEKKKNGHN